jgi:hypothetical protein
MDRRLRPLFILIALLGLVGAGPLGCDSGDDAPQVSSSHPGWKKADCRACHNSGHQKDHHPGECAECHGRNGAPDGHGGSTPCLNCHGAGGTKPAPSEHLSAAQLPDPEACLSCH